MFKWKDIYEEDPDENCPIIIEKVFDGKTMYRIGQIKIEDDEDRLSYFEDLLILNMNEDERATHFCVDTYDRWALV